jgi:hypothetical protein
MGELGKPYACLVFWFWIIGHTTMMIDGIMILWEEIYHDCEITRCKLFSSNQTTTKIDTSIPYLIKNFVHLSFFVFRSAETCLT